MDKKLVVAYFMHDHEKALAEMTLAEPEMSAAHCIGTTDEAGIQKLRDGGLMIEIIGDVESKDK